MKKGFDSLMDFAAEIERRAKAKEDVIADTRKVEVLASRNGTPGMALVVAGQREYGINPVGHDQLAEETEIPLKHYRRLLAKHPDLLANEVTTLLHAEPRKRLFRTLDGNVRAVRSDKFRTDLEYEHLAEAVLPVFMELDVAIMSYAITNTKMYIKVVDKKVERELAKRGAHFGDGSHTIVRIASPALSLSDSEVGYGSLDAETGYLDSFCSNLAWFGGHAMRKYHVGKRHELAAGVDYAMLSDDTKQKTAVATIAQIKDVVKNVFDPAGFNKLIDKVEGAKEVALVDDVVQVVDFTSRKLGLNETEGKSVLQHLIKGGDLSKFGLFNAVTRTAQDAEDYDRATALEKLGASVIDVEWKEIVKQAA